MRSLTSSGMRSGRLWRSGDRQATSMPGRPAVVATSSRASAPHPITSARSSPAMTRLDVCPAGRANESTANPGSADSCPSVVGCPGWRDAEPMGKVSPVAWPGTRDRGMGAGAAASGGGTAFVDEPPRRLRGDARVAAVRVGTDGHPELLVERRPADQHDVVVADPPIRERLDDDLHVRHRRREQRAHAKDVGLVLLERGDELVGVRVDPEVDDLEPGTLEHHPDEVLADVVDVALDGPDHDLADGLRAGLGEQRPENLHAGLHRVRREQDLRHEQDAVPEVDPDDLHARDERVVEDLGRAEAAPQQDLRPLDDLVLHPVVEIVVHLLDELVVGQRVEIDVLVVVRHAIALLPPLTVLASAVPRYGTVPYSGTESESSRQG